MWLKDWKLVRCYRACIRARFDAEDIKFDMYERACKLMELRGNIKLPEQEEGENDLHLWQQANSASNGFSRPTVSPMEFPFANMVALFVNIAIAGLACALWRALDLLCLNAADCITSTAMSGI